MCIQVQENWRKPIASLDTRSIYNSGHLSFLQLNTYLIFTKSKIHLKQELNITPKPTKNETKATLKVTQATEAKAEKEAKEAL